MSENLFLGDTTYPHLPDVEQLQSRIAHLEAELAKVTARYNYVRDITPEEFGELSQINGYFDSQVDAAIKERSKQQEGEE